jgi:hypothetical protein
LEENKFLEQQMSLPSRERGNDQVNSSNHFFLYYEYLLIPHSLSDEIEKMMNFF